MLFGLFEKYSATIEPSSKRKRGVPCINTRKSINSVFDLIKKTLEDEGFYNIVANKEYNDIFAEFRGFEVSLQMSQSNASTYVSISVFGEKKRGRTRRFLKKVYELINSKLSA